MAENETELTEQEQAQVKTPEERLAADPGLEPELAHARDEAHAEEVAEEAEAQADADDDDEED